VTVGGGIGSVVAIPVPGTNGLAISLKPNGYVPPGGSTSTLFIQDVTGRRHLRLDYGFNKNTGKVDFHWNQKGTFNEFGIRDHTPVGRAGAGLDKGARYFKYGGRALLVIGLALDGYEVVTSDRPFRQLGVVAAGWVGAWAGCKVGGAIGAAVGTAIEPGGGSAVGGFAGCFIGGAAGYWAGKKLMAEGIDYAEGHVFHNVEEQQPPPQPPVPKSVPSVAPKPATSPSPAFNGGNWADQPICSASVGNLAVA
jgi:hypothetical protein